MKKLFAGCTAWVFFVLAAVGNLAARDWPGALECAGLSLLVAYLVTSE